MTAFIWMTAHGEMDGHHQSHYRRALSFQLVAAENFASFPVRSRTKS